MKKTLLFCLLAVLLIASSCSRRPNQGEGILISAQIDDKDTSSVAIVEPLKYRAGEKPCDSTDTAAVALYNTFKESKSKKYVGDSLVTKDEKHEFDTLITEKALNDAGLFRESNWLSGMSDFPNWFWPMLFILLAVAVLIIAASFLRRKRDSNHSTTISHDHGRAQMPDMTVKELSSQVNALAANVERYHAESTKRFDAIDQKLDSKPGEDKIRNIVAEEVKKSTDEIKQTIQTDGDRTRMTSVAVWMVDKVRNAKSPADVTKTYWTDRGKRYEVLLSKLPDEDKYKVSISHNDVELYSEKH